MGLMDFERFNEHRERVMKKQSIELVGLEEKMNKSNIWRIFEKLKTFKLEKLMDFGTWLVYRKENKFIFWKKK